MDTNVYNKLYKHQLISRILEVMPDAKGIKSKKKEDLITFINQNFKQKDMLPVEYFDKFANPNNLNKVLEKKFGLKTAELLDVNIDTFVDPYKGTTSLIPNKNIIELQKHQSELLNGFLIGNLRSTIAFHGLGTGKTLTAVACARLYLQIYPKNKVIVITPSAVLTNFIEAILEFGVDARDKRYSFFTYEKWHRSKQTADNSLLIIDEAHNYRTQFQYERAFDKEGKEVSKRATKNIRGYKMMKSGAQAHKVLMLSATVFVNTVYDIENLLAISEGREENDPETFGVICSNKDKRYDYFKYRVSMYFNKDDNVNFPKRIEKMIPFIYEEPKNTEYVNKYKGEAKVRGDDKNPFYVYSRQNSGMEDRKIKYIMNILQKNPTKKYVIYTTFQAKGVALLGDELKNLNIDYSVISGTKSKTVKDDAIDGYNNFNNPSYLGRKYRVLIITKAGAEGVNLKETRGIFVMDGLWNEATYEQIVARAIRYKSHSTLPEKERFVEVYKLFVCTENEAEILEKINTGGRMDYLAISAHILEIKEAMKKLKAQENRETKLNDTKEKVLETIKKHEIEHNKKYDDTNFDPAYLATLKLRSAERREYLKVHKKFDVSKYTYVTQDMIKEMGGLPSTEFYLLILQKTKQHYIDEFVKELAKIPSTEKSVVDLPIGKKLMTEIMEKKITGAQLLQTISNYLRPI